MDKPRKRLGLLNKQMSRVGSTYVESDIYDVLLALVEKVEELEKKLGK